MPRSRLLLVSACAMVAAALVQTMPASAAPSESLKGTSLTGVCPYAEGASKDVRVLPRAAGLWAPFHLLDDKLQPTNAVLIPHSILLSGIGLKTRHLIPGVPVTKGGSPPADAITCEFAGETADGAFQIEVIGTVR